jgi:hypothetical protein
MEIAHDTEEKDVWGYIWGSVFFSASKAYKQMSGHLPIHAAFKWLWKSSCQNKHRVFFWLILKGRLNTRGMLRRRNMDLESFSCVLCNAQVEETIDHLLLVAHLHHKAGAELVSKLIRI